jgi:hypothetical protein
MHRIRDQLAAQLMLLTQLPKNPPMSRTGPQNTAIRTLEQRVDKAKRLLAGGRRIEMPECRTTSYEAKVLPNANPLSHSAYFACAGDSLSA